MEVGDLYIAGKTVLEAKDLLLIRYSRILHDPVVNLVLKDFLKGHTSLLAAS